MTASAHDLVLQLQPASQPDRQTDRQTDRRTELWTGRQSNREPI